MVTDQAFVFDGFKQSIVMKNMSHRRDNIG